MAELSPKDIQEILRIFAESELEELRLEVGGTRLHVSKAVDGLASPPFAPPPAAQAAATIAPASSGAAESSSEAIGPVSAPAPPPAAAATPTTEPAAHTGTASREGLAELRSPLLGVFYRRPSPDQPAFVEVGSTVGPDDPVCIVDVMKMFTRIAAGTGGRIAEILVEDGQLVEHGQVLMRIEPA